MVLGELLQERYVLDGALIAAEDVATVNVRSIDPKGARALLEGLLRSRGFVMERQGEVTVVKRLERPSEPERVFVYRPKFRSVSYLQGAIRSFVPRGRFAGAGSSVGAVPGSVSAPSAGSGAHGIAGASPFGVGSAAQSQPQSTVTAVVPAQGAVLASQDVLVFEGAEGKWPRWKSSLPSWIGRRARS